MDATVQVVEFEQLSGDTQELLLMTTNLDFEQYVRFSRPQCLDRHFHELEGLLLGLLSDRMVGPAEVRALEAWLQAVGPARANAPFSEVADVVESVIADGIVDEVEVDDLLWVLGRYTAPNRYYDAVTADLQRLQGMMVGILADNVVTESEARALQDWIEEHGELRGAWPYDELSALLTHVLADGVLSTEEGALLRDYMADFVSSDDHRVVTYSGVDLKSLTLSGICAADPCLEFAERTYCFTGKSARAKRSDIHRIVEERGGRSASNMSSVVDYLIVGADGNPCWAFSCYGRKIEAAMDLRRLGKSTVVLVHETDFWDAIA